MVVYVALTKLRPPGSPIDAVSKAGTELMVKDGDDDQTVLMLAASTGSPGVLELVASRLPRAQVSWLSVCSSQLPHSRVQIKAG